MWPRTGLHTPAGRHINSIECVSVLEPGPPSVDPVSPSPTPRGVRGQEGRGSEPVQSLRKVAYLLVFSWFLFSLLLFNRHINSKMLIFFDSSSIFTMSGLSAVKQICGGMVPPPGASKPRMSQKTVYLVVSSYFTQSYFTQSYFTQSYFTQSYFTQSYFTLYTLHSSLYQLSNIARFYSKG